MSSYIAGRLGYAVFVLWGAITIVFVTVRVVPGDPDASFLIQKLNGTQTLGNRMPDGGPYLTTATVNVIRQWIQDGAPQ